jgi:hypothetical protein
VKHTAGFFLPAQARAICVFKAGSVAGVAAVNQRAGVPFTEVVEAFDLLRRALSGSGPAN